jgi:hypothetical protein
MTKGGIAVRSPRWPSLPLSRAAVPLLLLVVLLALLARPVGATRPAEVIVLPGASSAEGIAAGRGAIFYAGDLFRGDIFRGNIQRGTAELFIDAPTGRMAAGMATDLAHNLLFVAGALTGQAYIYDLRSGATVATYPFGAPGASIINDVTVTKHAPGSPTHCRPSSTSCRSAGLACRGQRSAPLRSAVRRPTPAGTSTSTASRPPPTARP